MSEDHPDIGPNQPAPDSPRPDHGSGVPSHQSGPNGSNSPHGSNGRGRKPQFKAKTGSGFELDPNAPLPPMPGGEPPHSKEAEAALLGAMILDSEVIGDVCEVIKSDEDFYFHRHGLIFRVLAELYQNNQPVDMVQLNQKFVDMGKLQTIGGVEYLIELGESVPHAGSAMHYARIVRDKAVLRDLMQVAQRIWYETSISQVPVKDLLDQAEAAIFGIAETETSGEASPLGELLADVYNALGDESGASAGLESGFYDLDKLTSGLQKGEMVIVAGRPSMGKTAFALNMAENIAINTGEPIAIFSLEMGKRSLAQRLLCSRSGVDAQKLRTNDLSRQDFEELSLAMGGLQAAQLYIDDTPGLTITGLRSRARRLAKQHHVQAIFIDYLQLLCAPGAESRQQEVSNMSRQIKALARELEVPVVCLSQLNRGAEQREGHKPRMSDLRESGSIEQDADVILLLHREEYYHHDPEWRQANPDKCGTAEVIVAKQRNGPTGTVDLQFNSNTTRFNNLASHRGSDM